MLQLILKMDGLRVEARVLGFVYFSRRAKLGDFQCRIRSYRRYFRHVVPRNLPQLRSYKRLSTRRNTLFLKTFMMIELQAAPALSTPAEHLLNQEPDMDFTDCQLSLSDAQLYISYEIERTVSEIRKLKYRRVALQFPDSLLREAPRVYQQLQKAVQSANHDGQGLSSESSKTLSQNQTHFNDENVVASPPIKFFILGDTSYAPCCVDEVAAEHVSADVVVHYGSTCLSPTATLPVIHVFTKKPFPPFDHAIEAFAKIYSDHQSKVILLADVVYQEQLNLLAKRLGELGYANLFVGDVQHDPSSLIPNRTIPGEVRKNATQLKEWSVFHLAHPPKALLLILSSRVKNLHILPVSNTSNSLHHAVESASQRALNRRYAMLTSVSSASVFGILVNTLSVKNFGHVVDNVKAQILAAGKKSYTFVVGKLNAAKVANFSEVDAWVVIGCWESSLVESKDFWKPLITPFELKLALQPDDQRLWTGEWRSDLKTILDEQSEQKSKIPIEEDAAHGWVEVEVSEEFSGPILDPESAPPEFDLRRGRYVSQSATIAPSSNSGSTGASFGSGATRNALAVRAKGDLARIGGELSPGAEFLKSKRTWQGLGSDFEIAYDEPGTSIEEGRTGIARGYTHANGGGVQG